MAAIREILAKFGVSFDTSELNKGAASIEETIGQVKNLAAALGTGLALGAVKDFVLGMTEQAHEVQKQAEAFGLSAEEMQQWQGAAEIAGASTEDLNTAFKMIAKNVGAGSGPAVDALKKLGVQVTDANGKVRPMSDLFEDAGGAIGTINNAAERAAIGSKVFGRQFQKILPLISQGSEGMAKLRGEVTELGGTFDDEFIKQSADVNSNMKRLEILFRGLKIAIAAEILPAVIWLTHGLVELGKPFLEVIKHSQALKTAAVVLGTMGLAWLSAVIGPLGAAFATLASSVLLPLAGFLLIEDFFTFLSGGDSLFGRALDRMFGEGTAKKVLEWIDGVKREFMSFIEDLSSRPQKLIDDWNLFTSTLAADVKNLFGPVIGGAIINLARTYAFMIDLLIGGWDNFSLKTGAIWDGIKLMVRGVAMEISFFFQRSAAQIEDAFTNTWGRIKAGALNAIGFGDGSAPDKGTAVAAVERMQSREMSQEARERERISSVINGPQTSTTTVQVTVPPGTPEEMARKVGDAAAAGAAKGAQTMRGAHAALVPGAG